MKQDQIMVLGVGNILYTDEGFGIRVIEKMHNQYGFPENISLVDGGVPGTNLLGLIAPADHLIVVDAVRGGGTPGTLYRIEESGIPRRIRAKNSLHQTDLIEALTLCQIVEKIPETVILGVEPENIHTLGVELTPAIRSRIDPMIRMVLSELDRLGGTYRQKRPADNVQ